MYRATTARRLSCTLVATAGIAVSSTSHALQIDIVANGALAANQQALTAFNRAADSWEALFTDPITVTIDAGLAALGSNILGQASSVLLNGAGYDAVRDLLVADAADETDDGVVAFLPDASQVSFVLPSGYTPLPDIATTKANLKALGVLGLDAQFGAADASITFSSNFTFDFDRSDGVSGFDFEAVAAHEIGHALGFTSVVDAIDQALAAGIAAANVTPHAMDLFRFGDPSVTQLFVNPQNDAEFTTAPRNLLPGPAFLDDLVTELPMSEGVNLGDGRQASHFKDNLSLGLMDPTLLANTASFIGANDIRVLDLLGWDFEAQLNNPVPESATLALVLTGLLLTGAARSRSGPGQTRARHANREPPARST